jgi:hypothetical protein
VYLYGEKIENLKRVKKEKEIYGNIRTRKGGGSKRRVKEKNKYMNIRECG